MARAQVVLLARGIGDKTETRDGEVRSILLPSPGGHLTHDGEFRSEIELRASRPEIEISISALGSRGSISRLDSSSWERCVHGL
jgi:hypothetical protein